jgi:peroxiredoxin
VLSSESFSFSLTKIEREASTMMSPATTLLLIASILAESPPARPADFRLQDFRGAWHVLDEARASRVVVIAFVGTECPLARAYAPRLAELARAYEKRGVTFFGVDSNEQDGPVAIGRYATAHGIPFPILKDVGHGLADRLGADRTPEVFVLDENRAVRYSGRVDDQYALGVHRPSPTSRELVDALDALLASKAPSTTKTVASGCKIGRATGPADRATVTYSKDVARILQARCVSCHRPGEIAPFSLTDYRQASGWASMIVEVVHEGRMPPWHASPEYGKFSNEARLTPEEKKVITDWVASGSPEGNPADLPPPVAYAEGWRIPKPDLILEMPEEVTIPAEGSMPYVEITIDPKLTKDVWISASQVRPGNPSVLHHLVVTVHPPGGRRIDVSGGDFLAAYAPGMPPRILPEGVARRVPAGSKLHFQVHYTPKGTKQVDRSRIGLTFADPSTVRKDLKSGMAINLSLKIPAGAHDYVSKADLRFDQAAVLFSMMPHMHLRGKSMRFEAEYPDGRREVLLDVPRYEFDWQNLYVLAEPKTMPEGTVIHCEGHFDNSSDNPNNPNPKKTVKFGEQTNDEMLVGYMNFALRDQNLSLGAPIARPLEDGKYEVTFRYRPEAPLKKVELACKHLGWEKNLQAMAGPDAEGRYSVKVTLPAGTHEYKFVLDGQRYIHDPGNPEQVGFFHDSVIKLVGPKEKN